ncbi:MAG: heme lyase CcmF/NrfE family subunit [Pseudomonadota bacterium]
MTVELGHYALILSFVVALLQASIPLAGASRNNLRWMAMASPAALVQLGLVALAFGVLLRAHVLSDFSVRNVVENSHSLKPMLYKVTGLWGNHEGSLLLWVLILSIYGAAVALFGGRLPLRLKARVLSVQAMIALGFLAFMLFTSNPFARMVPAPADGNDLNPLLQDPGLAFHPPMLYLGYVGFSMAFSFAVAALIEGKVDAAWARWVRPWTLAAWIALTAGIGLGSWWAYYELGWGGWWFWDPVENSSFMPWLVGTALLHSAIVVEKRGALKAWTILLAILTFGFSLIGTFLVRSGVLTSVHAFATDPARGIFVLALLVLYVGGALALFAWRAPALKGGGLFQPISREGALLLNNLLLATACATVFIGTLYPLFLDLSGGGAVSVGPPYYNATFVPVIVPLLLLMGVGPLLAWKRGDLAGALGRLWIAALLALLAAAFAWWLHRGGPLLALVGIGLGTWLAVGTLIELAERIGLARTGLASSLHRLIQLPRAALGMTLAHLGLAIAILGMTGSSAWKEEQVANLAVGQSLALGSYEFRLDKAERVEGPNYWAYRGSFTVTRDGAFVAELRPERRLYLVSRMPTTESAIHTTGLADLYAVLGEPDGKGGWTVRLYREPLVPLIWGGVLVMVAGGFVSLSDRRYRVGAPAARRAEPLAAARA